MTEFVIELIRLHGDERWSDWGEGWWKHVERLGELPREGPGGWQLIDHFRARGVEGEQLDWGALLYRVEKKDLIAVYSATGELRPPDSNTDNDRIRLSELPDGDRYGLVVVEVA